MTGTNEAAYERLGPRCYAAFVVPEAGALVISLDFELFWGMRDVVSLDAYRKHLEGVHEAVPRMLDLFERYDVHATWATVGLLFARDQEEARHYAPALRPTYDVRERSPYEALDRPGLDQDTRCYFASDLVDRIVQAPHQELGTHTFSHYYCTEPGQSAAQFEADLDAAIAIAKARGIELRSLVFPRNQANLDYLDVLRNKEIEAYRGVPRLWALHGGGSKLDTTARRGVRLADNYLPLVGERSHVRKALRGEPLDVAGSRFLRPHTPRWSRLEARREQRMRDEMTTAAQRRRIYHLWWHPHNFGAEPEENLALLGRLLEHARHLRFGYGFESRTMGELTHDVLH